MTGRLRFIAILLIFLVPATILAQVNVESYMLRGRSSFSQKDLPKAIECFNVVIANKQKPIEAYFLRGVAKYYLGDLTGARDDLSNAILLHPYYAKAFQYRAVVYDQLKDYSKSLADFNIASDLDPYNSELYMNRGVLKSHMGDFKGAIDDYTKTISMNPKLELAYLNRAMAWQGIDSLQKALDDCNKVIRINNYSDDAFIKRGTINKELKNLDEALEDYNYAIRLNEKNPLVFFQRAILHLERQDTLSALEDYNKVLEIDPKNSLTYFNRAILYSTIKDYDQAVEDYSKVIQLSPKNVFTWFYRGTVYMMQNKYLQAVSDFSKAIEVYPEYVDAYQNRSYAYHQLGRHQEAQADRRKLIQLGELAENEKDKDLKAKKDFFKEITDFNADWGKRDGLNSNENKLTGPQENFRPVIIPSSFNEIYIELKQNGTNSPEIPVRNESSPYKLNIFACNKNVDIPSDTILTYIRFYDSLISNSSDNHSKNLLYLGILQLMIKDYNASLNAFEVAKNIEPDNAFLWFCLASVKYEMLLEMEEIYSESMNPELGFTVSQKPKLIQAQDFQKIARDLDRAIQLNSSLAIYYYNRANIKNRLHQRYNAIFDYTMALVQEPELAQAYLNRGLTHVFMGEKTKGCQDLSKAGELGLKEVYPLIKKYCK